MRTLFLAVTGAVLGIIACTAGGTSTLPVERTPVASVSITLPSPSIMVGQTENGTAVALDASGSPLPGRSITWQTSSAAIAHVDAAGVISGIAPGTATISAASEGVTNQASLSVVEAPPAPVASVSVALASGSLNPGQTTQATATTRDASNNVLSGRAVSWSSSDNSVATVNSSGVVTAVAVGSAQIKATSEGQNGSATLTVTTAPPVPVASVSVSLANNSRNPGQTTQATATTRDANNNVLTGRSISWSSSNTAVATVSGSGLVTAVAVGTAQINATSEGQTGSATLTVAAPPPVPVASVSVSLASNSLNPGQTTQATATTRDANNNVLTGRVITWSSSDPGVATVSSSGLVTA
ncbi:MAG TPA: Ig-like domain-containing protein, partial [Gemmatimonadaceae bacterium]|nr:Ig-like domain-containing protein [Gemmatimonadaceae bacterium]